jgi:putative redox protein
MPKAIVTLGKTDFETNAVMGDHSVVFDEPVNLGGQNKGPGATEMLCSSLGACTAITIKMYANHKQWNIDSLTVEVDKSTNAEGKNIFTRRIHVTGTLDADQRNRIVAIANKCPIHKILEGGNNIIETSLA